MTQDGNMSGLSTPPGSCERRSQHPDEWQTVTPVPDDAAAPPAAHPRKGPPAQRWAYRDIAGRVLGFVWRFEGDDVPSDSCTLTWCHRGDAAAWRFRTWPEPRPLYGLDRLAPAAAPPTPTSFAEDVTDRYARQVVVTGDEGSADAAAQLLPGWAAVTSPNGPKAARKADWRHLRDRRIVIWPAANDEGLQYAYDVAAELAALGLQAAIVEPPPGTPSSWTAADALAEGWTSEEARQLVDAAAPFKGKAARRTTNDRKRAPPQRDAALEFVQPIELWHSRLEEPYATVEVDGHFENYAIESEKFKRWLTYQFWKGRSVAPSRSTIEENLKSLEARAVYEGRTFDPHIRHGAIGEKVYVDLGDPLWRAVEISADGWRVIARPPVKFVRPAGMLPLPTPIADDVGMSHLRSLINVSDRNDDAQFKQLCAWIIGAYMPRGPYPLLLINGEEGSSKTTTSRMLQALTDPSEEAGGSFPQDQRELFIRTKHARILFFDNLSHLSNSASDDLARIATGASFSIRKLRTDDEQKHFSVKVPVCLNGIPDIINRPDLLSRTIVVTLERIEKLRTERDLWAEFEQLRPMMLAGIFDAVAAGIRHYDHTIIEDGGRMADFERFITAAEIALGWEHREFSRIYREMREGAFADAFDDNPVCVVIHRFMANRSGARWEGSATELYGALKLIASEDEKQLRAWPRAPNSLSKALSRSVKLLRQAGIDLKKGRGPTVGRKRLIILQGPIAAAGSAP
jgi:putative DNA primase/helicase